MAGILHIFRVGAEQDQHRDITPEYQVNYTVADGNSYARTFVGREPLFEFLAATALVPEPSVERTLRELDSAGHATIPDVEIPEHQAAAIGLEELPSDF